MRWQDELKRQPELPPVVERRLQETYAQVRARASEKQEEPMNVTSIARKTVVGALIAAALATTAMAGYASGSNAVFADFFRAVFGGGQEQAGEPAVQEDATAPQKLECRGFTFTIGRNCYDPVTRMGVLEVTVDNPKNGKGLHVRSEVGRHPWSGKRPDWEDAGVDLRLERADGKYFNMSSSYIDTERSTPERVYLYMIYDNTGMGDKSPESSGLRLSVCDFSEPSEEVQKELDEAWQHGIDVYDATYRRLRKEGKYHGVLTETIEVPLGGDEMKSWQATNENGEWEISVSEIGLRYNYPLLSQARDKIVLHFADGTDYTVLVMEQETLEDGDVIHHLDQVYVTLIDPVLSSMTFDHMIDMDQLVSVTIDDRTWKVTEK